MIVMSQKPSRSIHSYTVLFNVGLFIHSVQLSDWSSYSIKQFHKHNSPPPSVNAEAGHTSTSNHRVHSL